MHNTLYPEIISAEISSTVNFQLTETINQYILIKSEIYFYPFYEKNKNNLSK